MNGQTDPLSTALKEITEAQALLESLILSSEQFDYPRAKMALRRLKLKIRDLRKAKAEFEALLRARTPNIRVVDFRGAAKPSSDVRRS